MSSVRHARPDTEGERLTSTSQHPVTHRDRVVHRFAQSGVARRRTGVQSLGYGPGPHAERVIGSRFEAAQTSQPPAGEMTADMDSKTASNCYRKDPADSPLWISATCRRQWLTGVPLQRARRDRRVADRAGG